VNDKVIKQWLSIVSLRHLRSATNIAFLCLLAACANHPSTQTTERAYVCQNPARFANTVVGDGQCVSLIKSCSSAPNTSNWRPGAKILDYPSNSLTKGTIIATFKNGRYPNKNGYHAAIYMRHDASGIWVWDQWLGKPVHQRLIRIRHDRAEPANTAQAYRVVQ
jgi:hypothetical protein